MDNTNSSSSFGFIKLNFNHCSLVHLGKMGLRRKHNPTLLGYIKQNLNNCSLSNQGQGGWWNFQRSFRQDGWTFFRPAALGLAINPGTLVSLEDCLRLLYVVSATFGWRGFNYCSSMWFHGCLKERRALQIGLLDSENHRPVKSSRCFFAWKPRLANQVKDRLTKWGAWI